MNNMNKTKPPKDREFLGLVQEDYHIYWDIFFWATKEDGINGTPCYVDRMLSNMPEILGWFEMPDIEL